MANEIATLNAKGTQLDIPTDTLEFLKQFQGAGYSDKVEDGLTPILSILQDNSGEVKKQHERHMDGAEAGCMIIRSLRRLYPGQPGLLVQPFGFFHTLVEWTGDVGEGTPVGRFPSDEPPADMFEAPDPQNPGKKVLRRKSNMNRLVDTREHYVNVIDGMESPFPVVVPMSGSNHASSRRWTEYMKRMVQNGVSLPGFCRAYRLSTTFRKKGNNQTWFAYEIEPSEMIRDDELLQLGAKAFKSIEVAPLEANLNDLGEGVDDLRPTGKPESIVDPASVI